MQSSFFFHYTSTFVYVSWYTCITKNWRTWFSHKYYNPQSFLPFWTFEFEMRSKGLYWNLLMYNFLLYIEKHLFFYIKIIWHRKNGKRTSNVSVWYKTLYDMAVDVFFLQMDLPFVKTRNKSTFLKCIKEWRKIISGNFCVCLYETR